MQPASALPVLVLLLLLPSPGTADLLPAKQAAGQTLASQIDIFSVYSSLTDSQTVVTGIIKKSIEVSWWLSVVASSTCDIGRERVRRWPGW